MRKTKWYEHLYYRYAGNCYRTECMEATRTRCWRCRSYWALRVVAPLFYRDVRRRLWQAHQRTDEGGARPGAGPGREDRQADRPERFSPTAEEPEEASVGMKWATYYVERISTGEWKVVDTTTRDSGEATTVAGWPGHDAFVRELTADDVRALHGIRRGRVRPVTPQGVLL